LPVLHHLSLSGRARRGRRGPGLRQTRDQVQRRDADKARDGDDVYVVEVYPWAQVEVDGVAAEGRAVGLRGRRETKNADEERGLTSILPLCSRSNCCLERQEAQGFVPRYPVVERLGFRV
jgi:hypothetical protein